MIRKLSRFLFGSIRGRLILSVAAVHAVMMTLFIGDLTQRQRALLLNRQIEQATALSQALATSAAGWIATDDVSGLQEIVEAQRRYPEILFAYLTDNDGLVLADIDKSRRGLYMLDLPREARQTVLGSTPKLVDIAVPAIVGGRHAGWARVGLGQKVAGEKLAEIIRSGVLYALAAVLVGSVIAWFMGRRITRRLYAVQETIDAIRSGNRLARSSLAGIDEPAVMAREFNAMLDVIAQKDAELREKTEELEHYFTDALDLLCIADTDGYFRRLNPEWEATLGLPVSELEGRRFLDFVHPDDMEVTLQVVARLADQQEVLCFVNRYRHQSGEYRWIEWRAYPAGKRIYAVARDITERKLAEEELHRLNRELRALTDCNQVLVRAEDEQSLLDSICRIICDEAGYRMAWVGYAENDEAKSVRPMAWAGFEDGYLAGAEISWADTERGRGPSGTAIRNGKTDCIQDFATKPKAAPWRENALQRGYRSSIALPLKDEADQTFGVLNIYSAKTNTFNPNEIRLMEELAGDLAFGIRVLRSRAERKQAEELIRKAGAYNRSLVEASLDPLVTIGPDGRITDVNAATESVTGCLREELIGTDFSEYFTEPEKARAVYRQVFQEGLVRDYPLEIRHRDGQVTSVVYNASVYRDEDGQVLGVFAAARDITERKRTEEALSSLNEELELRVKERTAELEEKNTELERMNRLFVGRELRMVELKERVRELEQTIGG